MRKFATAAAAATTLGLMAFAGPAFADEPYRDTDRYERNHDDGNYGDQDRWNRRDAERRFDFDRHERGFDRWERSWREDGFGEFRHHRTLSHWRLVRRLEAQGYTDVRGLRQSRFGFGWRAFAYDFRGQPVMLRINPYTGRVLNARYLRASY